MCSCCKCQMCLFVRYVLSNVILHVMMFVSIFHSFTSLKLLHLFRFDMSTMVVTIQLMVDIMALFIQIFYDCSSNFFFNYQTISLFSTNVWWGSFPRILWGY